MLRTAHLLLIFLVSTFTFAQAPYFQQEVDTKINVTLDDHTHTLTGKIDIEYTNNAPYPLDKIYFHLWPNAYSNQQTAFAKQKIALNDGSFYFAKEKDLGHIDGLHFTVDGQKIDWQYIHPDTTEIAIIHLNQPLPQGQTITISTPFTVKIPKSVSRLGHIKQSYQITQWYPKPAVLDHLGWHPMPYLELGEFYSEFGDFDVTITLPQNYIVGATGELTTPSEITFLERQVKKTEERAQKDNLDLNESFPTSSSDTKTIHYLAKKVHDFAWFADKRFNVLKSNITTPSGKKIDTWAMFPDGGWADWQQAPEYINRALVNYSRWVGEYPYPQATAIMSALSAGNGMEYPMITVIGDEQDAMLDDVITHEVGHNWFYGILASNERDHAWMDEGMNTYYETRYMQKYYNSPFDQQALVYLLKARNHQDLPPSAPIGKIGEINYGLTAYAKPSISLATLAEYVGQEKFDHIMKLYYQQWQFRHPYPNDFRKIWEENTDKDLDWFFDGVINTTQNVDYKILSFKQLEDSTILIIKNYGQLKAPLLLDALKNKQVVNAMALDGFTGTKTFSFSNTLGGSDYNELSIDNRTNTLDLFPQGNSSNRPKPKLKLGIGLESATKRQLFVLPMYAWNNYDKSMLGLTFFNEGVFFKKLYYELTPLFSFGSKTLVGTGKVQYSIFPKGLFHKIIPTLSLRRFSNFRNDRDHYSEIYNRIVPSIDFVLKEKNETQNRTRTFHLAHEIILSDAPIFEDGQFKNLVTQTNQYELLSFVATKKNALREQSWSTGLEYAQYDNFDLGKKQYLKLLASYKMKFNYQKSKQVDFGFHGAYFLQNDARYSTSFNNGLVLGSLSSAGTGADDYAFRNLFFGRSENRGILGQQIYAGDGNFKHPVLNGGLGHSNDWLFGFNLIADLPVRQPSFLNFRPYFDAVFYGAPLTKDATTTKKMYSAGVQLDLKVLQINFPLFNDKELDLALKQRNSGGYLGRISYSLRMNLLSPKKIVEKTLPF